MALIPLSYGFDDRRIIKTIRATERPQTRRTQAGVLRFGEGAQGRRLWLTPQLGRSRGELGRPRGPGRIQTFDSCRSRPVREPIGELNARRIARAALVSAYAWPLFTYGRNGDIVPSTRVTDGEKGRR